KAPAGGLKETARRFQDPIRGSPPERCKLRGDHTALRGASCMERFGHRTEILAQPSRFAGGDSERAKQAVAVESVELSRGCGGAEDTARAGRVESLLVVAWRDGLGDFTFDFDAHVVGEHHLSSGYRSGLGQGQSRRKRRCGWVRQQSV